MPNLATRKTGTIPWKFRIPKDLALRFELKFCHADLGKPTYGVRSHIIVGLIRAFMQATESKDHLAVQRLVDRLTAEEEKGSPDHDNPQP